MKFWRVLVVLTLISPCGTGILPLLRTAAGAEEPVVAAPLPPAQAAETLRVPAGFRVTLFAGEPDVRQPVGMCMDDRGRLWVAEAYNYPHQGTRPGDRIIVFTDSDGDGHFNDRTVFFDQLNYVTGIEVGFGGAWVMSPPFFFFIPDADGDLRPDAPPRTLLDGFGNHANAHNLANGFAWGPDGWLYGTHGRTNWSLIGKPGTAASQRERFDGGVYRYHPTRHVWEPYADGTTNPWGIDWNDRGDAFVCNCVGPHLFHVLPGAHYEPWRNRDSSRFAYERIATIADHSHYVGSWDNARQGLATPEEDDAGGGHAHCGILIYQGGQWPETYRNSVLLHNIHGHRINHDRLQTRGSGYVAQHAPDFARSQDAWFMGVNLLYGPDGNVYSLDWSDTGECHSVTNTHRETGRIFKISYGDPMREPVALDRLDSSELVELHEHRNEWFVRHARRLLHERAARGDDMNAVLARLRTQVLSNRPATIRLRYLWTWSTLTFERPSDDALLADLLTDSNEDVRRWAVRLLADRLPLTPTTRRQWIDMAERDPSPRVRLALASASQRLALAERWEIAAALLSHVEDQGDANLPLMNWYAIEPLVAEDAVRFARFLTACQLPLVSKHIARRCVEWKSDREGWLGLGLVVETLSSTPTEFHAPIIQGILAGLSGHRTVPAPPVWRSTYQRLENSSNDDVRELMLQLALVFDDPHALMELQRRVTDGRLTAEVRQRAIDSLIARRAVGLATLLQSQLDDRATRSAAIRGLAQCPDEKTPQMLLDRYASFDAATRQDALQTLSSRVDWARNLVAAIEHQGVARADVNSFTVRQLNALHDKELSSRVAALWGGVRDTPAERRQLIDRYKRGLTNENLKVGNDVTGHQLFQKTCAACHRLFGEGAQIGPDITGAQRQSLDYLLENLLDPNALVPNDYRMVILETIDGRVLTGIVVDETPTAITLQTATERVVVPTEEVQNRDVSPNSMMPEGQLQALSEPQVRDLIKYLMRKTPLDHETR